MKYIDPRFVILILGYVFLSEFLNIWLDEAVARASASLILMIFIYWIPSRSKTDFINWIGGSVLTAIGIFTLNADFPIAFTLMLLAVFFLAYFREIIR